MTTEKDADDGDEDDKEEDDDQQQRQQVSGVRSGGRPRITIV